MSDWSEEETDDPVYAARRNFYKVEKWSREAQQPSDLAIAVAAVLPPPHSARRSETCSRIRIRLTADIVELARCVERCCPSAPPQRRHSDAWTRADAIRQLILQEAARGNF